MDLIKIGRYIAGKRKSLGLTQRQLAEKLGMSDKSVSKWERGVCLPDVSVYMELCEILGVSINEFLAGEDIDKEVIIEKTDANLLEVTKATKHRLKHLRGVILCLALVAIAALAALSALAFRRSSQPGNYISAVDRNSAEMKTAQLLSGTDGAFMFRFHLQDGYKTLTVYLTEYQNGKLIAKKPAGCFECEDLPPVTDGMIVFVPDLNVSSIRLIVTDDRAKFAAGIPILQGVESSAYLGRSAVQLEGETPLQFGTETGLAGFIYDADTLSALPIQAIENENGGANNDYVYYFSVRFDK